MAVNAEKGGGNSMIILRANPELRQTFERLIETMKVPVKWNGIFVVVDNYIILQGEVRSLFFHFDTKKVATNIIDIPVREEDIRDTAGNVQTQNAINMILYAFGKWGNIKGLRVDKNYGELGRLFSSIMREIHIEPEYNESYFRFYRNGMRTTYEDVIQMALEYQEEEEDHTGEKESGLWHKIIWNRTLAVFNCIETTLRERRTERIGNNFYRVGYLCPVCGEKMHMVIYPEGREFRIETEEGGVLLARACTCDHCRSFYTPRPGKLLVDGDVYALEFEDDDEAYEDYLQLLGQRGARVSNYHFNRFVDPSKQIAEEAEEEQKEICDSLPELSDTELKKLSARMEEGFYPDESTKKYEERVREQGQRREEATLEEASSEENISGGMDLERASRPERRVTRGVQEGNIPVEKELSGVRKKYRTHSTGETGTGNGEREEGGSGMAQAPAKEQVESVYTEGGRGDSAAQEAMPEANGHREAKEILESHVSDSGGGTDFGRVDIGLSPNGGTGGSAKNYAVRFQMLDRYSGRQLRELKRQVERDRELTPDLRKEYLEKVNQKLIGTRVKELGKKVDACEGKSYALIKRVLDEVEAAELPADVKEPMRKRLFLWKNRQAGFEVAQLVEKMPSGLDRGQYQTYIKKIRDYENVDLTPYEEKLRGGREKAEQQEIVNLVKRARKVNRGDLAALLDKLQAGDFLPDLVLPYAKKVEEKIRQMDEEAIHLICPDPLHISFEEGVQAYGEIERGDFLPELKADALKMLAKRLSKLKTDECELLVKKLQTQLAEAGVADNERHHFYPARKVLLHQATPEETDLIEFAMASYAAGRGLFEYPVFVVDATRNGSGKEGMILTPDHLYYSTLLCAYGIDIASIDHIHASKGLLNRGIYVHQRNGAKTKIPYMVDGKEMEAFAEVLDDFVHYLQEKPDSRNLVYLASEKHETICCFRCGCAYRGGAVCPKCGYQNNE